jgi:hypothetical protein
VKDEELVTVLVPRNRLTEVYALLGTEPPAESMADRDIIEKAVQESPDDTKRFLDLLAASPDEWLSIGEVREKLGLGVHELAGVLSTLPRRWRGRYRQAAPLPFEIDGQGSERRYRMEQEVAEVVMSAPPPPKWTLERFREVTEAEGGPDAIAVLEDGLAWALRWHGEYDFGTGPTAPIYFVVPNRAGEPIKALSFWGGRVGIMYRNLRKHPPFTGQDERDELTERLNEIDGISIPLGRPRAFDVKLEFLRSPEVRAAFFGVFDDVARRLSHSS